MHVDSFVSWIGSILCRTYIHAEIAARAVLWRHLDGKELPLILVSLIGCRLECLRRHRKRFRLVNLGPDGGMRTHQSALVALDADLGIPDRNLEGEIPFLPFRGADRPSAVDWEGT